MNRISSPRNSKLKNFCLYLFLGFSIIVIVGLVIGSILYNTKNLVVIIGPILLLLFVDLFVYFELVLGPEDPNYYPGPITRNQKYEQLRGMEIMEHLKEGGTISDFTYRETSTQE